MKAEGMESEVTVGR